ncbi:MAG: phosphatase PAP2 family protein [Actinomycetota bacterium]|nr:phosphatase PAP2 family protein [Actinomycetota bacterium]
MSAGLAGMLLVVLAFGVLALTGLAARWVVGHPERIRNGLTWVTDRPVVAWVRSRYPRQWRFLGRRFAPGEAAGLTLTLGIAAVLSLGVGFGQLVDSVLEGDGVAVTDRPIVRFLAAHREPWATTTAQVISDMGSPAGVAVTATVVGGALAWIRRSWLPLLVVVLGAAGIGLINMAVKRLVSRKRPPLATAVLGEDGFSFPSGHTVGTTVVWLLSAWMVSHWMVGHSGIGRRAVRVAVWSGALLMIVAVGATRVYLGVHFPSDVLAGWALGAAWAVTIALVVSVWEQSHRTVTEARPARARDDAVRPARRL